MNYENMINTIVEEVYKKINSINEIENKPKAVLLYEDNNKEQFKFLKQRFEVVNFEKSIRDCQIVIISKLCMRGLCNLAVGHSVSDEERFILKMLMKGKKVYVLEDGIEYKRYKKTAPKALYNKYMSYEDEIINFGVEIIKDINFIYLDDVKKENLSKTKKDIEINDEFSLNLTNQKLISESDLKKPMISGIKNVLVDKKSIVTPLAKDFIRIHHLKLKRM